MLYLYPSEFNKSPISLYILSLFGIWKIYNVALKIRYLLWKFSNFTYLFTHFLNYLQFHRALLLQTSIFITYKKRVVIEQGNLSLVSSRSEKKKQFS